MRRTRMLERALGLACFALAGAIVFGTWRAEPRGAARPSVLERLVGPFASLVASAQWVRADLALRAGHFGLYCERADAALELAPADPQAWIGYASRLLFDRASPEREPDRARRESWTRAGIDLLLRAEKESADPGEILVFEGGVFAMWAEIPDEERPWPESAEALRQHAIQAFARARALGQRQAARLEAAMRDR
ncbi:MAG: hypothetical protein IPJ19_17635 [Planctomycetes bacterium]|nr:hypothetical protein [Planctomycetota bacterium]